MGDVVMIYKISPEGPEVDLAQLKKDIEDLLPADARVQQFEEIPLFFGMKGFTLNFLISDKIGGIDEFEEKVDALPSVASIVVEQCGLA